MAFNYDNDKGVASSGGVFNTIYAQTTLQNTINNCMSILDFDIDLNVNGGKDFGPPRIASPSPLAHNIGIDCNEYAVTYTSINNGGEIIALKADDSSVLSFDIANAGPSTDMCYNGLPSISYNVGSDIITVAWEFFDCNYCIPANVDCPAGGPVNVLTKPGYNILARRYDNNLHRLTNDINIISDPTPINSTYRYPSVAGRHGHLNNLLFSYAGNITHSVYKISDLFLPSLMPVFTSTNSINPTIESELFIVPKVNKTEVCIKIDKPVSLGELSIYDLNGKCIFKQEIENIEKGIHNYILPKLPSVGMYLLNFKSKEFQATEKFVTFY